MKGFIIVDLINDWHFLFENMPIKKVSNDYLIDAIKYKHADKYIILLFDDDDDRKRYFINIINIPSNRFLDWRELLWGDIDTQNEQLHIIVSDRFRFHHYYYGQPSSLSRQRVISIGRKSISLCEYYSFDDLYRKLFDILKDKYNSNTMLPFDNNLAANLSSVEKKLDDLLIKISIITQKIDSDSKSSLFINNSSSHSDESFAKLDSSLKYIIDILENTPSRCDDRNESIIHELKTQLEEYKVDLYHKSMRKLGIDAMLELVEFLYSLLDDGDERSNQIVSKIIDYTKRVLRERLNVRCVTSETGSPFNERTMISHPGDLIPTENEQLHNTVARSLRPAFYWTMPMVNGQGGEFLFIEEVVCLYKFSVEK